MDRRPVQSGPEQPVRGRGRHEPVFARLGGPGGAGQPGASGRGRIDANSSGPTETQQALYSLPQSDYNVISSGNNGYNARTPATTW